MDPLSISVSVLTIGQAFSKAAQSLGSIVKRYRNAPSKLLSLQAEAQFVSNTLDHIRHNAALNKSLENKAELRHTMDTTLTGCLAIYRLLEKDLQKIQTNEGEGLDWKRKGYMLFHEDVIENYLTQIRGHLQGLNLLLMCLQLESVAAMESILREKIFEKIAEETSTIRSLHKDLDVPESIYDCQFIGDEDQEFAFDDIVINSKAYRQAYLAARRQSASNESSGEDKPRHEISSPRKSPKTEVLSNASTVVHEEDSKESQIIPYSPPASAKGKASRKPFDHALTRKPVPRYADRDDELDGSTQPHLSCTDKDLDPARMTEVPTLLYPEFCPDADGWQGQENISECSISFNDLHVHDISAPSTQSSLFNFYTRSQSSMTQALVDRSQNILPTQSSDDLETSDTTSAKSLSMKEREQELYAAMRRLASISIDEQLYWAEEVFRHLHLSVQNTHVGPQGQSPERSRERLTIQSVASQLVDALANSGSGHALYLKAEWMETNSSWKQELYERAAALSYQPAVDRMMEQAELWDTSIST